MGRCAVGRHRARETEIRRPSPERMEDVVEKKMPAKEIVSAMGVVDDRITKKKGEEVVYSYERLQLVHKASTSTCRKHRAAPVVTLAQVPSAHVCIGPARAPKPKSEVWKTGCRAADTCG